jgi:hypothetical protein
MGASRREAGFTPADQSTAEDELAQLWQTYAGSLAAFEGTLGSDLAARFTADVLTPFQSNEPSQQMRAVAAWVRWRPFELRRNVWPTDFTLTDLRDRLTTLIDRSATAGWFGRRSLDPDSIDLLTLCRNTLDQISRVSGVTRSPAFLALRRLAKTINALLASFPPEWRPGAALQVERLQNGLVGDPMLWKSFHDLTRRMIEHAETQTGPAIDLAVEIAERLIQAAGPLMRMPAEEAGRLDRMLDAARGWCAGFGIEFLPREWSSASPPILDALRSEGVEVAAVYRPDEPAGTLVRLKTLGIIHNGEVVRPAVVTVSAGPAPPGFAELEELVATADDPAGLHLQERLHGWRDASLNGGLESAAMGLHVEFWDRDRAELDPSLASAFADHLADVLRDALGLTPFFPSSFPDHPPGWVEPVDGGRMTTGRVREVLRPGLVDRGGELRVPARAVVE